MKRAFSYAVVLITVCGACQEPKARLNAPPHGVPTGGTHKLQGTYVYMNDNALLADMTVSDIHFLPHRAALNTLGRERLCRLAELIEEFGGDVRLNTDITGELLDQRLDTVRKFLAETGVNATVRVDLPGGDGMRADEAILVKTHEGTYQPPSSGQTSTPGASPAPGGSSGYSGNKSSSSPK